MAEKAAAAGAPPQTPLTDDDLRVIESNAGKMDSWAVDAQDVLALVAEVRRLRGTLEAIVYASDQCRGHRECGHSMEPWRKVRELLGLAEDRP